MLTEYQVAEFRVKLEQEQSDLETRLVTLDRRLARNGRYNEAEDEGDSAVSVLTKEETLSERNRLTQRLAAIKKALHRMDDGTYGLSEVSGRPIPLERLQAMPTATTLVDEQPPQ